jgi:drug/metabolite transporter (DMT)-like permease
VSNRASPYLLLSLAPLFWAGNVVIGRAMRHDIPPVATNFWRWAIAGAILLPFVAGELREQWPFPSILAFLCFNHGVAAVGAARGSLFIHLFPVYAVIVSGVALGESPQLHHFFGIALVLLGIWLTTAARRVPREAAADL